MTDKAREEFEGWWLAQEVCVKRWIVRSGDGYIENHEDCTINEQWSAWQASRAALGIELPEGFETYCGSTEERVIYADEMKDVLVAAGLKVAP